MVIQFRMWVESLQKKNDSILKKDFKKMNIVEARRQICSINWKEEFEHKSTNECYNILLEVHEEVVSK